MERLHDTLDSKIGRFDSRKHRFNYAKKANYQFANTNIRKYFNNANQFQNKHQITLKSN